MPELPDVEIIKQFVEEHALHKQVDDIQVVDQRISTDVDPKKLQMLIAGKSFKTVERHGKHIFIAFNDNAWLTMHFGMTGNLLLVSESQEMIRFERMSIIFKHTLERLVFVDQRILGRVGVTSSPHDFIRLHSLGPDALQISLVEFLNAMQTTRAPVKAALMDQRKIAGIGNVYADEILFQSKIDPHTPVSELSEKSMQTIYKTIYHVLRLAIELHAERGIFPKNFITRHRKKNETCPSCGGKITTIKIDGRTTYFCPTCQNQIVH